MAVKSDSCDDDGGWWRGHYRTVMTKSSSEIEVSFGIGRTRRHDAQVMTGTPPPVTVRDMATDGPISSLVLQEFRLHASDTAGDAARIVAAFSSGVEPAVPLLTSIDDDRDVAIVRGLHAGEHTEADPVERAALDPLVATWQPVKRYGPRITERSENPPTYYRLAVTESGINNAEPEPEPSRPPEPVPEAVPQTSSSTRVGLLWIGRPVGTYAGLLTLLGSDESDTRRSEPRDWLPLSRSMGVRIYESQ